MRHALAVLAGIAVVLPVMGALASANGHTAGALPDRYAPWARHRLRPGWAAIRVPVQQRRPPVRRPAHAPQPKAAPPTSPAFVASSAVSPTSPRRFRAPSPPPAGHGHPARHEGAGLRVSIEAPRTIRPGGTYAYRIRLANRGTAASDEITVRNTLPAGVVRTGTSLPGGVGGYAGGRDATLVMPRLAPGRSATARFVVRVRPKARGELVARSRIASVGGERVPRTGGNVATVATRIR